MSFESPTNIPEEFDIEKWLNSRPKTKEALETICNDSSLCDVPFENSLEYIESSEQADVLYNLLSEYISLKEEASSSEDIKESAKKVGRFIEATFE